VDQGLDLALALPSWDGFRALTASFSKVGNTGIRFRIAGIDVDLIPFGEVEDPVGVVEPPSRGEAISVWAFEEIFAAALPMKLTETLTIRVPTVAGYAAAKLGAWLDRSEWHEAKDALDLALILYWYAESEYVHDRLYETAPGQDVLLAENSDLTLAAAHLLGTDVSTTIGSRRRNELLARWPGNADLLERELQLRRGPIWPSGPQRRLELIDALTRGLSDCHRA
jgi:predicted nucleotidyltransferase